MAKPSISLVSVDWCSMALHRRDHPDYEILGYNRSQASRDIALERGN